MSTWSLLAALLVTQAPAPKAAPTQAPATAADVVTLRDGKTALGQVVEAAPRGKVILLIRRAWAQEHLPEWLKRWEAAEAAWVPKAKLERRERLVAWKRERAGSPKPEHNDVILEWLDQEIEALKDAPDAAQAPLMAVQLARGEVRGVQRRPKEVGLMLRQGWRAEFKDVESMPVEELRQALEGRGFALDGEDPAPVDALLPIMPETDARWLARRAATELSHDPGLRFTRYQGLILPEGEKGAATGLDAIASSVKSLLGDAPAEDPLAAKFREATAAGHVGLVVTKLDLAPGFATVTVESTLFVRMARDRWEPATSRNAIVRPDALQAADAKNVAADPQVQEVFKLVESLGLGTVPADLKARSLNVGAATQAALGEARAALNRELEKLELPVSASAKPHS
ncbi:MAG TPA: hypothetical protein VGZ22_00535 [Isosphaeraceae bacterium]|nr:hypothetical protein [Isosphaeraceae bacterium]